MATPTSTNTRILQGLDSWFISGPMFRRDRRLREARVNADRTQRELRRDRGDLERKERHLMSQLKSYAQKGDIHKAKCLSHQISHYRVTSDRNFEAAVMIDTRAQLLVSNHVVNRAEVEAIKGIRYANVEEDLKTVQQRQEKYDTRLDMYETMEDIMNEGMDDVYEWGETHHNRPKEFEQEADSVVRQGIEPKCGREYFERDSAYIRGGPISHTQHSLHINVRLFNPHRPPTPHTVTSLSGSSPKRSAKSLYNRMQASSTGATVYVPTLDISVDMLQRLLSKDAHAIRQLGLESEKKKRGTWKGSVYDAVFGSARRFRVGMIAGGDAFNDHDGGRFVPYDFTESLKHLGLRNGGVVWVEPVEEKEESDDE
ncbi:hypothetical protein SpCBS45565_g04746 [Spizellomyces sp. 'palustris']|nr:hypothetical protein SpCBS45565_g04746 [Spizellomyces sp. 'palustris']